MCCCLVYIDGFFFIFGKCITGKRKIYRISETFFVHLPHKIKKKMSLPTNTTTFVPELKSKKRKTNKEEEAAEEVEVEYTGHLIVHRLCIDEIDCYAWTYGQEHVEAVNNMRNSINSMMSGPIDESAEPEPVEPLVKLIQEITTQTKDSNNGTIGYVVSLHNVHNAYWSAESSEFVEFIVMCE